jgi:hypothetical protein
MVLLLQAVVRRSVSENEKRFGVRGRGRWGEGDGERERERRHSITSYKHNN